MWIQQEACTLMYGIHYVRESKLGQIVKFTNHGSVHELSPVVRGRIEVMMNKSLGKHGDGLRSGPVNNTDVLYDMLCEIGLHDLIRSDTLILDVYPYTVGRVSFVL